MKKTVIVTITLLLTISGLYSQSVGIGTTSPNSSAILDLTSNTKGLLLTRLTGTERTSITTPATGLMLYQTNPNLLYLYNGINWQYVPTVLNQTLSISGSTTIWDCSLGLNANITLNGDITLSLQNVVTGYIGVLVVKQDAVTGNRKLILPVGSKVNGGNEGVLQLTTLVGSTDIVSFYFDGTTYYWNLKTNFN